MSKSYVQPLIELGFSETEAKVFGFLVQSSPATGYRISHAIGKQTANTYKAIAVLEERGAIIVDDGETRLCRAVPPDEFLEQMERDFQRTKGIARASLMSLHSSHNDDRVYQLKTVDQVLQRAMSMVSQSQSIVLCDIFPGPFDELSTSLDDAFARKVRVVAKSYRPSLDSVSFQTVHHPRDESVIAQWPGQHLTLVTDASEFLLALFSRDMKTIHQAIWSNSTFLSCMQHNNVASEIILTASSKDDGDSHAGHTDIDSISLLKFQPPGMQSLTDRFGEDLSQISTQLPGSNGTQTQ